MEISKQNGSEEMKCNKSRQGIHQTCVEQHGLMRKKINNKKHSLKELGNQIKYASKYNLSKYKPNI